MLWSTESPDADSPDFGGLSRDVLGVSSFALCSECWLAVNLFCFKQKELRKLRRQEVDLTSLSWPGFGKISWLAFSERRWQASFSIWFLTLHTGFIRTDKQSLLGPQPIITIRVHPLPLITLRLTAYIHCSFLIYEAFISEGVYVTWIFNYIKIWYTFLVLSIICYDLRPWVMEEMIPFFSFVAAEAMVNFSRLKCLCTCLENLWLESWPEVSFITMCQNLLRSRLLLLCIHNRIKFCLRAQDMRRP